MLATGINVWYGYVCLGGSDSTISDRTCFGCSRQIGNVGKGQKRVAVYSPDGQKLERTFAMSEIPTGVCINGNTLYATTFESKGILHVLDLTSGKELAAVETGSGACSPIVNKEAGCLYVCNQFQNTVSEVDLKTNKVMRTVAVLREPKSAVISKDGKFLYVTNFLPAQRADLDYVAACVSVIDLESFTKVKDIQLANGSNALRGICITPDGKYVYVSHNLGRYTVPTSQLQQGWMNTSAFSVIDTEKQEFLGVVIVDESERGQLAFGVLHVMMRIYLFPIREHTKSV